MGEARTLLAFLAAREFDSTSLSVRNFSKQFRFELILDVILAERSPPYCQLFLAFLYLCMSPLYCVINLRLHLPLNDTKQLLHLPYLLFKRSHFDIQVNL